MCTNFESRMRRIFLILICDEIEKSTRIFGIESEFWRIVIFYSRACTFSWLVRGCLGTFEKAGSLQGYKRALEDRKDERQLLKNESAATRRLLSIKKSSTSSSTPFLAFVSISESAYPVNHSFVSPGVVKRQRNPLESIVSN